MSAPIETRKPTCLDCGQHVGWCDNYGSKREPPLVRGYKSLGHHGQEQT